MNTQPSLPERVKALRKAAGMSQAEFAKKLFLSRGLLNGIETGREKTPSPWIVQQIDLLEQVGVQLLNKLGDGQSVHSMRPSIRLVHEAQGPIDEFDELREAIRAGLERTIEAAGNSRDRLGWILEQTREHLAAPKSWLTKDAVNLGAREHAKKLHAHAEKNYPSVSDKGARGTGTH